MKTVVNVTYTFTRPVYKAGNIIINNANSAGNTGVGPLHNACDRVRELQIGVDR